MFKEKAIKGLICLGVIGMLASSSWAVGKKPAQEQAGVKKAQAKAQSETEKELTKETEEKGTQAVEAKAIEPKLIMEWKFDEPIVDVIFDEATMTVKEARALGVKGLEQRKVTEMVKVQYPKVIVTEKAVKFLDKEERVKNVYKLQPTIPGKKWLRVKMSNNRDYIGVTTLSDYEGIEVGGEKFTMLNNNGKILWEISTLQKEVIPSPNGQYAVGLPDYNKDPLYFYNSTGETKVIEDLPVPYTSCKIDFSKDSKFWAVNIGHEGAWLILFDDKGNELWRRKVGYYGGDVTISNDGELIATTGSPNDYSDEIHLFLFNNKGDLLWKQKIYFGSYHYFSKDNRLLFTLCEINHLYLFEIPTGKLLWQYQGEHPNQIFDGIATTPDFKYILLSAFSRFSTDGNYRPLKEYIYLFDKNGKKLWEREFDVGYLSRNPVYPYMTHINISSDGSRIMIGTKEGIKTFQNPFVKKVLSERDEK